MDRLERLAQYFDRFAGALLEPQPRLAPGCTIGSRQLSPADDDPFPDFRAFCLEQADQIRDLLIARSCAVAWYNWAHV